MPISQSKYNERLAKGVARFYAEPLGFVMYAYPWDTDASLQIVRLQPPYRERFGIEYGPDVWACEYLDELGAEVKKRGFDGFRSVDPIRMAVASGHGIGKSAMSAWLVDWIMSTRPHAQGSVTANSGEQLQSKTWSQIAKWTRKCITGHWFKLSTGKGSLRMSHIQNPESWFCVGITWREENAEAFAGQHAANSTSFYLFDEASSIPDIISEVAEGGLTDGEPMFFKFGNPTRNSGDFHRCFHGQRHRWIIRQIDSRNCFIPSQNNQTQSLIDDYGLDSDIVKIRVRGMFPSMSAKQFISTVDVDSAFGKHLKSEQYNFAPKILTCDPAWEGDDELVIGLRQGLSFRILQTIQKNDNDLTIANILARWEDDEQADGVFVDGGFGTGIISAGRTMGRGWMIVWFSAASSDPGCINKRSEMWNAMKTWLKEGGAIPKDTDLYNDLIGPELVPRMDGKIQLEKKQDMKMRGLKSPNKADALALTFAYPVSKKKLFGTDKGSRREYDPYKNFR